MGRRIPHRMFDLKGVAKRRAEKAALPGAAEENSEDDVLGMTLARVPTKAPEPAKAKTGWDQDFREQNFGKPLCLPDEDLKYLEAAVSNDCALLAHLELIDYSMLLAAAPPDNEDAMGTLGLGIIDWL